MKQLIRMSLNLHIVLISVMLLAGCANNPGRPIPWKEDQISGLSLQLVAIIKVQNFKFDAEGYVAATVGTAFAVAAPEYEWRIFDGKLQIYSEAKLVEQLTLLEQTDSHVKVITISGEVAEYKITRPKHG
jgi:outer membrane murein-binding lipoprotein Lpp